MSFFLIYYHKFNYKIKENTPTLNWKLKQQLQEMLKQEQGYKIFPGGFRKRFALAYPNSYFVGMSNLGFHIIYDQINNRNDSACERFFLPDKNLIDDYTRTHTPLMSMETQTPLHDFALIGFAISFEMDYFNILQMLSLGKVKLLANERTEKDPIVMRTFVPSSFA